MKRNRVLVYFDESSLAPKGGPAAVCYYYSMEQNSRGEKIFEFLPSKSKMLSNSSKKTWYKKIINDIHSLGAIVKMIYFKPQKVVYDLSQYDLIHFHSTDSLYKARTSLNGFKGKVILQSHAPEPRGREMFAALSTWIRYFFPFLKMGLERMDIYAFKRADYIIFPCPEAEEPYYHLLHGYEGIHNQKKENYRYLLTGIPKAEAKRGRESVLSELNIPKSDFVISYVGRHNKIKGYDLLKEIGAEFLNKHSSTWIVCAGREAPLKRLVHNHWIEVGWTNEPHSYIAASDVFVLPNRETYFDIIMMELLSLGKIVVASRTGGNKYFEKNNCPGVFLFDNVSEAIELLEMVRNMPCEKRKELSDGNILFYKENLTVEKMYEGYVSLLNSL